MMGEAGGETVALDEVMETNDPARAVEESVESRRLEADWSDDDDTSERRREVSSRIDAEDDSS